MKIQTNIESLQAQHKLVSRGSQSERVVEHLASGNRISSAADDAAGLSISTHLNANARSLDQAVRNSQDGISLVQVAEGGMNSTGDILTRLRELAIQGSSDTIGNSERSMLNREVFQLRDEIDRISNSTEYNGRKILSGNFPQPNLEVQVGIHPGHDENTLDLNRSFMNTSLYQLGLASIDFSTKEKSRDHIEVIDKAISMVSRNRANLGALMNRFQSAISNGQNYSENLKNSKSRILDTDMALETSENTKNKILSEASISVISQANQNPSLALRLLS